MTDWSRQEAALRKRREEILGHLLRIEDELDDPAPRDDDDRSSERQGDEVLEALGSHEAAELKRIDLALQRLADGEYGICASCGDEINPKRLEVVPDTPLCAKCASKAA